MASGIVPLRFGSFRKIKVSRKVRSPTAAGIWAERSPEKMMRDMTRLVVRSHSTAAQSQQSIFGFHEDELCGDRKSTRLNSSH